ncbi:C-factor-like [Argiope bruennichi]|uniref:C-factor like protein n=1 Tax=Argiope bruennichi TaxID=94029 RepID=A0A8T0E5A3_ARGBR|nr:C-factor-like [Argiope bruennichi]KAF8766508.1 C-factor like protein [Argiope bruennichi]
MRIASVLVTGANRGLGLEFVKQLINLPSPPNYVFATCRDPSKADDLQQIAKSNTTVKVLQMDIKDDKSFPEIRKQLEQEIGAVGLNLLINNAGIAIRANLDNVTKEAMMENFEVNTVSPLLLSKELLPLLKTAASKADDNSLSCSRAAIVNITSKMGSIDDNTSGGSYSYRTSKAALNMVTKSLSVDLKPHGILCFLLHPGWVQTDMGGKNGLITPPTSVSGMLNTILQANEKHCGLMFNYDGKVIPW